tara:strand:- start:69 stop:707 length:639 start_codon:yes stop_codon:yes gene_type:complete
MASFERMVKASLPGILLVVALTVGVGNSAAGDSHIAVDARKFVATLADRTIQSLTAQDIDKVERRNRFRKIMLEYFAFRGIAKWVLGRYWRRASQSQREEFLRLFEDLMVVIYADRFAKYSGEKLDIGRSEIRGKNDILVHSLINRPEGLKPVAVIWRISQKDENFKIVDLMVEGLSMGLTQQKEFASVIRKNGGKIEGLLNELRKRLAANS